jgi:hypothetical protein
MGSPPVDGDRRSAAGTSPTQDRTAKWRARLREIRSLPAAVPASWIISGAVARMRARALRVAIAVAWLLEGDPRRREQIPAWVLGQLTGMNTQYAGKALHDCADEGIVVLETRWLRESSKPMSVTYVQLARGAVRDATNAPARVGRRAPPAWAVRARAEAGRERAGGPVVEASGAAAEHGARPQGGTDADLAGPVEERGQ